MKKLKKVFPVWTLIMFGLTAVSGIIYSVFCISEPFAEFYNTHISSAFRWLFAKLSGAVNFSMTEFLVFMSPVILVYAVISAVKRARRGTVALLRMLVSVTAIVCYLFVSFVNLFAAGYRAVPVAEKMELDTENISTEELALTMLSVTEQINELCRENVFPTDENGATVLTESYNSVAHKVVNGYDAVRNEYGVIQNMKTVVKPIILSEFMTYSHISGVYSFYTGEANINTNFPDYIVVSTIAHEMAHQRGIAPEDEASFMGYLALINSEDAYLRYCGYMDVYTYLSNALYESGSSAWSSCRSKLCEEASAELRAYSEFFEEYRDNAVHDISEAMNDSYLQSQGTQGTVAYDLVTELVVAYTVR